MQPLLVTPTEWLFCGGSIQHNSNEFIVAHPKFHIVQKHATHKQCEASNCALLLAQNASKIVWFHFMWFNKCCVLRTQFTWNYISWLLLAIVNALKQSENILARDAYTHSKIKLIFISERKNFIQFQTKKYFSLAYWIHSEAILVCGSTAAFFWVWKKFHILEMPFVKYQIVSALEFSLVVDQSTRGVKFQARPLQ